MEWVQRTGTTETSLESPNYKTGPLVMADTRCLGTDHKHTYNKLISVLKESKNKGNRKETDKDRTVESGS